MALILADRVKETTTTTGTGTMNLSGAASGFQTFVSGVGNGNTTYYCITSGTGWEVGLGTVTSGTPDTLSRTTILASSNSGSAITLAGTSTVFGDAPAALLGNAGLYGPVLSKPVPTSASTGFTTWANQGTATIADTPVGITITAPTVSSSQNIRLRTKTAPSTPYTCTALFAFQGDNFNGFCGPDYGWYDGTKLHTFEISQRTGAPSPLLLVNRCSSVTTYVSSDFSGAASGTGYMMWLQVADDGTNVAFRWSYDGYNFVQAYTVAKASGYLANYNTLCWGANSYNANLKATMMSYTQA